MTWTTIPDTDVDPDSAVTTGLMTLLRDNPIAIANGDSGAPPVVLGALDHIALVGSADLSSSAATIDFPSVFSATYQRYEVFVHNSTSTLDALIYGYVTDDNGSTYESTSYDTVGHEADTSDTAYVHTSLLTAGATFMRLGPIATAVGAGTVLRMTFHNPYQSTIPSFVDAELSGENAAGLLHVYKTTHRRSTNTAWTGFRLDLSTGDFEAGTTVEVFGIKSSV